VVCLLIRLFDGAQICVGASEQHVVQHLLLRARAVNGSFQEMDVRSQRPTKYSAEPLFKPPTDFTFHVVYEVAVEFALVGIVDHVDLQRIFVCEDLDQRFLVGAEAFHGFAKRFCGWLAVPCDLLWRPVAK